MFENSQTGWFGSYSIAGKTSAEKYIEVINKDKIVGGYQPKLKTYNYFATEEEPIDLSSTEKNSFEIFNLPKNFEKEKFEKLKLSQQKKVCDPIEKLNDSMNKYKAHQIHHKEQQKYLEIIKNKSTDISDSLRYNPNMNFIYKKILIDSNFNNYRGRDENLDKNKYNDSTYYLTHSKKLNPEKNAFVELIKGTIKPPNTTIHDTRILKLKGFLTAENEKKLEKEKKEQLKKSNKSSSSFESNINNKINKRLNTLENQSNYLKDNKAINFNKTVSRNYLNNLNRDKEGIRPFFLPNYSLVTPKTINKVDYSNSLKKTIVQSRMKGIKENLTFDPSKIYYKFNNHSKTNPLDFNLMVSRPNEKKNPLPSYMIKNFNRAAMYNTTDKSLKLNNFENGDYLKEYTSFCTKKSFNKKINLNLLNDKIKIKNSLPDNVGNLVNNLGINGSMSKVMEYYTKNLDDKKILDKTGKNFDYITLKTVPNKVVLNEKEKQIFNIKFN